MENTLFKENYGKTTFPLRSGNHLWFQCDVQLD